MIDLDTNHCAQSPDALEGVDAERTRRKLRDHWSYVQPLVDATRYAAQVPLAVERSFATNPATLRRGMVAELDMVRRAHGMSISELWWRFFALGGMMSAPELAAVLNHAVAPTSAECDVIAIALNERSKELDIGLRIGFCADVIDA